VAVFLMLNWFRSPAYPSVGFLILGVILAFWLTPGLATVIPNHTGTLRALVLQNLDSTGDQIGLRRSPARRAKSWKGRSFVDVAVRVRQIICENLGVNMEQLRDETRFVEDIGAD
jgi:hypothetical protein